MGARRIAMIGVVSALFAFLFIPTASAVSVTQTEGFSMGLLWPLLTSIFVAVLVRRWFIPQQLKSLQVAFEIDDDLYEVHRITRTLKDSRLLLKEGLVGYGVLLYMMGLTGVLLLIAELMFDPSNFYKVNLYVIGVLILVPVIISPWETLNGQLLGRRTREVKASKTNDFIRRVITMALLIIVTLIVVVYGYSINGSITPTWLAFGMLTFMAPTILAYGRIMGASWNMLLISKWRTFRGRA
ncbi:hypothetical protein N9N91_01650, partial [Candidatus Poseidonia alphae]|nr:hypothetical protein [Candidatus Poseidonia alphae]